MDGAIAATRDEGVGGRLAIVRNELMPKTRAALIDRVLTTVISTPTARLAKLALEAMNRAIETGPDAAPARIVAPFDLFLPTKV